MRSAFLRVVLTGALVLSPALARGTILLFDQARDAGTQTTVGPIESGGTLPADYGDHVTGAVMAVPGGFFTYGEDGEGFTPDVTLDIFSAAATAGSAAVNLWADGYGDLQNVIFADGPGTAGAPMLSVRFTAAPGYVVDLHGFHLAGFGEDYVIAGVSVMAGAATLFSAANVLVEGDSSGAGHTAFAFDTPLSAQDLLLQVNVSNLPAGRQDNIALDSIRFGQTPPAAVPEPAVVLMLLGGLVAIGAARRTRR